MAVIGAPLTLQHRRAQLALRSRVVKDLTELWPALDWRNLDATYPLWSAVVAALVAEHRTESANLASAYLTAFRLSKGIPGIPPVVIAPEVNPNQLDTSVRVTSIVAAKASAARGVTGPKAMANAFVTSAGAITRLVLDGGRETIALSAQADPRAVGFERVTSSKPCGFCREQAEGVMPDAHFRSHDHCGCSAQPAYR